MYVCYNPNMQTWHVLCDSTLQYPTIHYKISVLTFPQHVTEDSSLLGCDNMSMGKWFLTFWRNELLTCSRVKQIKFLGPMDPCVCSCPVMQHQILENCNHNYKTLHKTAISWHESNDLLNIVNVTVPGINNLTKTMSNRSTHVYLKVAIFWINEAILSQATDECSTVMHVGSVAINYLPHFRSSSSHLFTKVCQNLPVVDLVNSVTFRHPIHVNPSHVEKTIIIALNLDLLCRAFFCLGELGLFHCMDWRLLSGSY